MKFTYKSKYGVYNNCEFVGGRYANGNIGIEIWSAEEGPITKVTVNPDVNIPDEYIAVKNYSENEGMDEFLKSMGIIAENPISTICYGYVFIPVYRLTEKGKEIIFVK